jgi:hypothetical protein
MSGSDSLDAPPDAEHRAGAAELAACPVGATGNWIAAPLLPPAGQRVARREFGGPGLANRVLHEQS